MHCRTFDSKKILSREINSFFRVKPITIKKINLQHQAAAIVTPMHPKTIDSQVVFTTGFWLSRWHKKRIFFPFTES